MELVRERYPIRANQVEGAMKRIGNRASAWEVRTVPGLSIAVSEHGCPSDREARIGAIANR